MTTSPAWFFCSVLSLIIVLWALHHQKVTDTQVEATFKKKLLEGPMTTAVKPNCFDCTCFALFLATVLSMDFAPV
jgi:hypothetical protein